MSSTGRSDVRDPEDHYATPAWATQAVLPHLPSLRGKRILEPSAGRGAIVRKLIAAGADPALITAIEPNRERADELARLGINYGCQSFETYAGHASGRFDIIIGNPPFILAEPHIRLACSLLAPYDPSRPEWAPTVAMLVRLPFLAESQCRADFRAAHRHDRVELVRRPSFTAEALPYLTDDDLAAMAVEVKKPKKWVGPWTPRVETVAEVRGRLMRTDSCAYAWGLFGHGRGGRFVTHEEAA